MSKNSKEDNVGKCDQDNLLHGLPLQEYNVMSATVAHFPQTDMMNNMNLIKQLQLTLLEKQRSNHIDSDTEQENTKSARSQDESQNGSESERLMNDVKEVLDETINSVNDKCISEDVKSTLYKALDEVSDTIHVDRKKENQQIVVHVGATQDIPGMSLKIIPKIPELKDLLIPEIKIEPKPVPQFVPRPKPVEPEPLVDIPTEQISLPIWMPQPPAQANCPFGLEFLSVIDTVRVSQTKMLPGFSEPSFIVKNNIGQKIYEVDVRGNCFSTFFCASRRRFEMSILNGDHSEVMHFSRPSERHGRRSLEVYAPFGTLIGKIKEGRGPLPFFVIMDPTNEVLFRVEAISGPPDFTAYTFGIMPTDGDNLVGKIKQETDGTMKKIFRENFMAVNYYINLDAKIKALILGASFLIDLIFFEIF